MDFMEIQPESDPLKSEIFDINTAAAETTEPPQGITFISGKGLQSSGYETGFFCYKYEQLCMDEQLEDPLKQEDCIQDFSILDGFVQDSQYQPGIADVPTPIVELPIIREHSVKSQDSTYPTGRKRTVCNILRRKYSYQHSPSSGNQQPGPSASSIKLTNTPIQQNESNHLKCHEKTIHGVNQLSLVTEQQASSKQKRDCKFNCAECTERHEPKPRQPEIKCNECDKFMSACLLRFHQLAVHGHKMCKTCGETFNLRSFKYHTQKNHCNKEKENDFKCQVCPKDLDCEGSFNSNVRELEICKPDGLTCQVCSKTFPSWFTFNKHVFKHPGTPRKFKCVVCGVPFVNSRETLLHKLWHSYKLQHSIELTRTMRKHKICNICLEVCYTKKNLSLHHKKCHAAKIEKLEVQCYFCPEAFKNHKCFRGHLLACHKDQPLRCYRCPQSKTFAKLSHLKWHLKLHERRQIKPVFKCQECSKTFSNQSRLTKHTDIHKKHVAVQCHICLKSIRIDYFNTHIALHSCKICCMTFPTVGSKAQKEHLRAHKLPKDKSLPFAFTCDFCGKSFRDKAALQTHQPVHVPELRIKCTLCMRTFATRKGLKFHICNRRSSELKFKCEMCGKSFALRSNLTSHKLTPHRCYLCPETSKTQECFRDHVLARHRDEALQCYKCLKSKTYASVSDLQNHLRMHEVSHTEPAFKCQVCSKRFSSKRNLNSHVKSHNQPEYVQCHLCLKIVMEGSIKCHIARHSCKICDMTFPSLGSQAQKEHFLTHNVVEDKPFTCDFCGKSFRAKLTLQSHLAVHIPELRIKCPLCMSTFTERVGLRGHMRSRHASEFEFKCKICGMSYAKEASLTVHKLKQHKIAPTLPVFDIYNPDKIHKCSLCPKVFTRKGILSLHMHKEHSSEAEKSKSLRLKCTLCMSTFSRKGSLQVHMHKRHASGLDFKCEVCGMSYAKEAHLTIHQLKHNAPILKLQDKTKMYKCSLCPKAYELKVNFTKHMHATHKTEAEEVCVCDVCGKVFEEQNGLKFHWFKHISVDMQQLPFVMSCNKTSQNEEEYYQKNDLEESQISFDCVSNVNLVENNPDSHKSLEFSRDEEIPGTVNADLTSLSATCDSNVQIDDDIQLVLMSPFVTHSSLMLIDSPPVDETAPVHNQGSRDQASTDVKKTILDDCALDAILKTDDLVNLYSCNVCNKEYCMRAEFDLHMVEHLDAPRKVSEKDSLASLNVVAIEKYDQQFTGKNILRKNSRNNYLVVPASTKCLICNISFATVLAQESHQQSHLDLKLSRQDAKLFKERIKTHGVGSYSCDGCNKKFFVRNDFKQHLTHQIINAEGKTICKQSVTLKRSAPNPNLTQAEPNRTKPNPTEPNLAQPTPTKPNPTKPNQKRHLVHTEETKRHIEERKMRVNHKKCHNCNKEFKFNYLLKKHLVHCEERNMRVTAKMTSKSCDQTFLAKSKRAPLRQFRTDIGNEMSKQSIPERQWKNPKIRAHCTAPNKEKKFLCEICGLFRGMSSFKHHMLMHSGVKALECHMCGRQFMYAECLKLHLEMHMRAMHFRCNICDKFFRCKPTVTKHLRLDHNIALNVIDFSKLEFSAPKRRRFNCAECSRNYSRKSTLNIHIHAHHSNTLPFKCFLCNKTFIQKRNWVKHVAAHDSVIPKFECDICKVRFPTRLKIEFHLKSHFQKRPFKCTLCSQMFKDSHKLRMHMPKHTGVSAFGCGNCGKKYKSKSTLMLHINNHIMKGEV